MRFGDVCTGISAASVAWHPLGFESAFMSEIDAFPSAVLAHRFPTVPNLGDMTRFEEWPDADIDVLVGGTPCQSFSVAGLRKGLDDPRGNLMLTYLAIARRYAPRWVLWENVPGVLSSNGGRDFGTFLGGLEQLGYGFAYRVLDGQYFDLAQRRARVFVVGCLGDWRRAAAVLFERDGLLGHPAPSRESREGSPGRAAQSVAIRGREHGATAELGGDLAFALRAANGGGNQGRVLTRDVAPTLSARTRGGGGLGTDFELDGGLIPDIALALNSSNQRLDATVETLVPIAFDLAQITNPENGSTLRPGVAPTMSKGSQMHAIAPTSGVRRLTPRECERLMGFPDDFTLIPWKRRYFPTAKHSREIIAAITAQCPDGPRYKALGNSIAVPVLRWIGERIQMVENLSVAQEEQTA